MAVNVQSKCRRGMSQISLYRLNIVAGANGRDCVGVAQVMKAKIRPANG